MSAKKPKRDPNLTDYEAGQIDAYTLAAAAFGQAAARLNASADLMVSNREVNKRAGIRAQAKAHADAVLWLAEASEQVRSCATSRTVLQRAEG